MLSQHLGMARVWDSINVHGLIVTGVIFAFLLFTTEQRRPIVPAFLEMMEGVAHLRAALVFQLLCPPPANRTATDRITEASPCRFFPVAAAAFKDARGPA